LFLTTRKERLLVALGLCHLWAEGYVEPIVPPAEPMHILAQQLLATTLQERTVGGLGRHIWPRTAACLPELERLAAAVGEPIIEHLLATGMLVTDQGMLTVGPEGERSYGFRHFMQLTTTFAAEPLLTVLHGRQEIGSVHPISVERRDDRPLVLLLGGRAWRVRQVDWRRRQVFVEASDRGGRSRWRGDARFLSPALCRAIRSVLGGVEPQVALSGRANDALADVRQELWWATEGTTTVVTRTDGRSLWWTFAGGLANRQLQGVLGTMSPLGSTPENLTVELQPGVGPRQLGTVLADLASDLPPAPVFPEALTGLKFSDCLPEALAVETLRRRFSDPDAVRTVAAEPITVAHGSD
jgi:ATP-dependent Lhr-like helicase